MALNAIWKIRFSTFEGTKDDMRGKVLLLLCCMRFVCLNYNFEYASKPLKGREKFGAAFSSNFNECQSCWKISFPLAFHIPAILTSSPSLLTTFAKSEQENLNFQFLRLPSYRKNC